MLEWFSEVCKACPQFPVLCRSLKLWRRETLRRAIQTLKYPASYSFEVVAAAVVQDSRFSGLNKNTLTFYFCEALLVLRGHLEDGHLSDPSNVVNNMLCSVKPGTRKWLASKISKLLKTWTWVQRPNSWPESKEAPWNSCTTARYTIGQRVVAKYRAKSSKYLAAIVVNQCHEGVVGLRFDGYFDIVHIPIGRVRARHASL
eukprot:TRINITY_DN75355_c0_g1_i1.p1 TRINITY_DN75355_c0_g1~~TRINITY_DN75355_c0_g1_i1.p1  ORF type:complete len:221 (+),score=11.43 TRINITY_DN75355_c0_g1_i1:61-663(+)